MSSSSSSSSTFASVSNLRVGLVLGVEAVLAGGLRMGERGVLLMRAPKSVLGGLLASGLGIGRGPVGAGVGAGPAMLCTRASPNGPDLQSLPGALADLSCPYPTLFSEAVLRSGGRPGMVAAESQVSVSLLQRVVLSTPSIGYLRESTATSWTVVIGVAGCTEPISGTLTFLRLEKEPPGLQKCCAC